MSQSHDLTAIPCTLMRGGTSKGPFFLATDLPSEPALRDLVLQSVLGSPHPLQIDGVGGGHPLASKVAIVGQPSITEADVDYLFAQIGVDAVSVDTRPSCGNMLSAVGPFAIERGLVEADDPSTAVRIHNVNTGVMSDAVVQTPGGVVAYDGNTHIDGVAGSAAPVAVSVVEAEGAVTGKLFPSGETAEEIDGIPVTLVDYAMPIMLVAAASVGLSGAESPVEIDDQMEMLNRLEGMRREAGQRMGLGDVSETVVPKIAILSPPRRSGTLTSRYLNPRRCHPSHPVLGSMCLAMASSIEGTVASSVLGERFPGGDPFTIEHPQGTLQVEL
ncbi:MAG: PrpF domain-containing protein, partial [Acidimicrobiia bacterium]